MKKIKKIKDENLTLNIILIVSTFIITIIAIYTGSYIQEGYDLKIGSISPKRFIAPREIENTVATQKRRVEAENSVLPLYKLNPEIQEKAVSQLTKFFEELNDLYNADLEIQNQISANSNQSTDSDSETSDSLNTSGQDAITQDFDFEKMKKEYVAITSMYLTQSQYELYKELESVKKQEFLEVVTNTLSLVMEQGVKDDDTKSFLFARDEINKQAWDDYLKEFGYSIITAFIEPNLIVDEEATEEAKKKKVDEVIPVILQQGEKIIDENERITEEIFEILDSLSLIKDNKKENYIPLAGAIIITLIIQIFIYVYMLAFYKRLLTNKKESLLLFTLYCGAIIVIRFTINVPIAMVPLIIFPMLIAILLDSRLAIIINYAIILTGALIGKGDMMFVTFFLISGTISTLVVKYIYERNKVISIGILISFFNALLSLGMGLFSEKNYSMEMIYNCGYALISGILAVIVTIGSLPFWEALFDVITPLKLLELTNPNSPLLRRLMIESPGTYHHSLIVANLAETAAYDLEANATLARVGSYYHDIGKLKQPEYFTENQVGENPHDMMEPEVSARIILQHVITGIDMAEEYKLPKVIKDIISQHHGTTLTRYFYIKAKKLEKKVTEDDFKYKGPIPQSKEAACVMLADTVEAAIRSKPPEEKNMQSIEKSIKDLIKSKLDDGQLDESLLTIKDLETIRYAFMRVFHGMYHERISYPKEEKSST